MTTTCSPSGLALQKTICAELLAYSQPAPLPQGWRFMPPPRSVRVCDTAKLITKLLQKFSRQQLVAAGLVAKGADELKPAELLKSRLFFRSTAEPDCFDVSNEYGRLFASGRSFTKLAQVRRINLSQKSRRFLFAANDRDAHVLAANEFSVLPIRDIFSLTLHEIHELLAPPTRDVGCVLHRFVICAWN